MNNWPEPEPTTPELDPAGYAEARRMRPVALWIIAMAIVATAAGVWVRLR